MSPIIVIKVGGSLLDWPLLPQRLTEFVASLGDVRPVLIVGGGLMADALRTLDRIQQLGETRSHALALRILDVSAHLLADLLPRSRVVTRLDDLELTWSTDLMPVLAPRLVLDADDDDSPEQALPHHWSITTDSIAARVALLLQANGLILLKSAPAPRDLASACDNQLVDRYLITLSQAKLEMDYVAIRQGDCRVPLIVPDP